MLKLIYVIITFLLISFISIDAYVVLNIKYPTTKYGFVYPNRGEPNKNVTYVLEGVDVLISLAKVPKNFAACKVTTPDTEFTYTLNTGSVSNDKVEFWSPNMDSKECGARLKNVSVNDSGRWKLQAITAEGDYKIQSFINLQVFPNFERPNVNFVIREGKDEELNVTFLANYCQISSPPLSGYYNVYDHCSVDLKNINRIYGGKWKVSVGVYGKIDEIRLEPSVTILEEVFDVGYNKTGSKINLYCNLKNSRNTTEISFCRFVKDGQDIGLRLNEGLSNGKYSYYGKSFREGDCGVTIETPEGSDYVPWKCALGLYRDKGEKTEKYEVKESIISLTKSSRRKTRSLRGNLKIETTNIEEVLGAVGNSLTLYYKTDFRIKYCDIKHPNGTIFSIYKGFKSGIWETQGDIDAGVCSMKLQNITINESGIWHFQLGHYDIQQLDEIKKVQVRVSGTSIVAINQNITTTEGSALTIKCKSIGDVKALEHCIFSLPENVNGFHISEEVTKDNAINSLYWYNAKNASLTNGDCQVTIKKINAQHFGKWQCTGKLIGSEKLEGYDYIYVNQKQDGLTIASISGIVVGAAVAIIAIGGGFVYYRRRKRGQPQRRQTYLSSTSRSSAEVTHFERTDPLVSIEEERQPSERHEEEREEIEMSVQEARRDTPALPTEHITSM